MVWRRPGVRFKEGSGGSGVGRCKVQRRFWRGGRCRPGVRFKEGSGGSGVVFFVRRRPGVSKVQGRFRRFQARCKVQKRFRRFRRGSPVKASKEGSGGSGWSGAGQVHGSRNQVQGEELKTFSA